MTRRVFDTNIIVRDRASIDRVFWLVELYGLASGSKLNKEKSWGIWLGDGVIVKISQLL